MREKVFLGLVHYPVYNKNKDVVATSVTNFDIHDISRTCRTYDISKYFIITPVDAQQELTARILGFWQEGDGIDFNKDRNEAFENTLLASSIEESVKKIEELTGKKPKIVTTSAKTFPNTLSFNDLSEKIYNDNEVYLLLFGTGWGLIQEVMDMSTYILEPIRLNTRYNHLSVRAAVAIILDRLFGEK